MKDRSAKKVNTVLIDAIVQTRSADRDAEAKHLHEQADQLQLQVDDLRRKANLLQSSVIEQPRKDKSPDAVSSAALILMHIRNNSPVSAVPDVAHEDVQQTWRELHIC